MRRVWAVGRSASLRPRPRHWRPQDAPMQLVQFRVGPSEGERRSSANNGRIHRVVQRTKGHCTGTGTLTQHAVCHSSVPNQHVRVCQLFSEDACVGACGRGRAGRVGAGRGRALDVPRSAARSGLDGLRGARHAQRALRGRRCPHGHPEAIMTLRRWDAGARRGGPGRSTRPVVPRGWRQTGPRDAAPPNEPCEGDDATTGVLGRS